MPKLTKWQKKVVLSGGGEKSPANWLVNLVIGGIAVLFVIITVLLDIFEKYWWALWLGIVWVLLILFAFLKPVRPTQDRGIIIDILFKYHRDQWLEFLDELNSDDRKQVVENLARHNLSPADLMSRIAELFLTTHRRTEELKTNLDEVNHSKQKFYTNALHLSLEWKQMETAYLLYHRSEDINSKILQDKVLGYTEKITQETSLFQELLKRFENSLNHLVAFELDNALSYPNKHTKGAEGFHHLDSLIDELEEWSGFLTEAAEEMIKEDF